VKQEKQNCPGCGQFLGKRHKCPGKVVPGIPQALVRPEGYNPRELATVLDGLRTDHKLGYNAGYEASRMALAMKPAKGMRALMKRTKLRSSLQSRFGKINWKDQAVA
jgi:hypothetical protein